ncbi:MAG: four helix bundle protein [Cyclobacteriaceae bacterium]|jgi:four helix bundle protein
MRDFRKYKVWDLGHELNLSIYKLANDFLSDEKFGLISQMRRDAYYIPSNISEGCC